MNKVLIIPMLLALIIAPDLYGQAQRVTYANRNQIENFFSSRTMVVMDANPMIGYNIVIRDAVSKYWTITPYEIITADRFDELHNDPALSFIFLSMVQLERDKQDAIYLYMNIVMGARGVRDITALPELLSLPLAYTGVDEESYVDVLPLMLRFAQIHINNKRAARNPSSLNNLRSYNNSNARLLRNMTLLVQESDLSEEVNTIEKIQSVYTGTVRIVSSEEIVQAIEEKRPNTAILHQVSPGEDDNIGRSYCQIFGTEDGKLYYFNHQGITQRRPAGMLARDFRLIGR